MQRAPLDKVVLDTKILDMGPPKEILGLALDPPDLRNIKNTILHLKEMGALLPTGTKNHIVCNCFNFSLIANHFQSPKLIRILAFSKESIAKTTEI